MLRYNGLGRQTVKVAVTILSNSHLEWLNISDNMVESEADALALFSALWEHPTIERVEINSCFNGQNLALMKVMAVGLTEMTHISLCENGIEENGASLIAACLAINPATKYLRLDGNEINDCGVSELAKSLKSNTNLRELSLKGNPFECGLAHFFEVLWNT